MKETDCSVENFGLSVASTSEERWEPPGRRRRCRCRRHGIAGVARPSDASSLRVLRSRMVCNTAAGDWGGRVLAGSFARLLRSYILPLRISVWVCMSYNLQHNTTDMNLPYDWSSTPSMCACVYLCRVERKSEPVEEKEGERDEPARKRGKEPH